MTHASEAQPRNTATAGHGDAGDPHHPTGTPGSGHGTSDASEQLGPVDVQMWGAGILATAAGLIIAVCFALATAGFGAY